MPGRMEFQLDLGGKGPRTGDDQGRRRPMRLLLLGDFSARPQPERPPLATRPTHRIDIDSLDAVIARLAPQLALPGGKWRIGSLDDFHPDELHARFDGFAALRGARTQPPAAGADLLGALLGRTGAPSSSSVAAPPAASAEGLDALIRRIVAPHVVADTSAQTQGYLAAVDAATAELMRTLLHDPAFQALEAAWRGVQWLIASLELDEGLQLHLFDVSREELLADVVASRGQLAQTGLYRAVVDRWRNVPGGEGWSLMAGVYSFGPGDADVGLLAALGMLAAQAGGPFVGAGDPALARGEPAVLAGWNALRHSEAAPWIGLAAPRVLLRRPYGKGSDPITAFAFEEFAGAPVHEHFLWGAGSLAVALLTGRAFTASGWAFEPGDESEIGDMPAYSFVEDGERVLQACAEQYLGEEGGHTWLAAGLMPLMSHRNANAVTLMRVQSVADPVQALAGLAGAT